MQPSITPSPSARAACAIRTASRIPPDFASLMLIPCATLGARGDVGERVAVLVDVDRHRRAPLQLRPARVARGQRLLAVLDAELGSCGSVLERLVERPVLVDVDLERTSVTARTARTRSTSSPSPPPSFSFSRRNRGAASSARRAMSSGSPSQTVHDVGGPARAARAAARPAAPSELPAEVVQRGVERGACAALSAARQARRRSPRARTGRRRAARRAPRRTRAPTRPTRRSGRSAPPRRSRSTPPCRSSTWQTSTSSCELRAITNVSASRTRHDPGGQLHGSNPKRAVAIILHRVPPPRRRPLGEGGD